MKNAIRAMRRRGGGSIVNTSSILGQVGCGAATAYQSTNGAVGTMTKTAAAQYALKNIRMNSIHSGLIASPMTEPLPREVWDQFECAHPMKRAGTPEEVAHAVLFLASSEAFFITGAELNVDGGYTVVWLRFAELTSGGWRGGHLLLPTTSARQHVARSIASCLVRTSPGAGHAPGC
jgi:NAD(P)-dependent dehydrogenase (short-subunit alcohol dehydrogenase family)